MSRRRVDNGMFGVNEKKMERLAVWVFKVLSMSSHITYCIHYTPYFTLYTLYIYTILHTAGIVYCMNYLPGGVIRRSTVAP